MSTLEEIAAGLETLSGMVYDLQMQANALEDKLITDALSAELGSMLDCIDVCSSLVESDEEEDPYEKDGEFNFAKEAEEGL